MKQFVTLFIFYFTAKAFAQFAPAPGKIGSSALRHDSSCFINWAKDCALQRGLRNIAWPDSGNATAGDKNAAIGAALQKGVVSLGDGGSATLTFNNPIRNGLGWDFAVFENSFLDTFLEFAFVEVSTDGLKYIRFPSESLTDTVKQIGAFGFTHPEKINNLAGKYRAGFGTPFDLEELKDSVGIDIDKIQFVRLIDVVGSMNNSYATRDSKRQKINDPWPTPFPSAGFDLDAVGVLHQNVSLKNNLPEKAINFRLSPNPSNGEIYVNNFTSEPYQLFTVQGRLMSQFYLLKDNNTLRLDIPSGLYYFGNHSSGYVLLEIRD